MKAMLLLLVPLVFASCRTTTALDPNTLKPSSRCMPQSASSGMIEGCSK